MDPAQPAPLGATPPSTDADHASAALVRALLALDRVGAERTLASLGRPGDSVLAVEGLVSDALERIGEGWERGDVSLAQVYTSAKLCEGLLRPYLPAESAQPRGDVALVVLEDQHRLGARIVRSVLACAGVSPVDYGAQGLDETLARVQRERPAVLLVSTLMLRSALRVRALTDGLRRSGIPTRVVVGGAPFRLEPALWREVGADAVGRTAADALSLVRGLSKVQP